ncbi:MAG: dockerin type I repeat-containing protein [Acutalibacteraceae bacterium]
MKKVKLLKRILAVAVVFTLVLPMFSIQPYAYSYEITEDGIYRRNSEATFARFYPDRPYYEVDYSNKTVTFYKGDVSYTPHIEVGYDEICGKCIYQVHKEDYIENMIFTCDYSIPWHTMHCMYNLKTIRFYNNCEIKCDSNNFYFCGAGSQSRIIVYGMNDNNKAFAETFGFQYRDLNDFSLDAADGSGVKVNSDQKLLTGIEAKTSAKSFINGSLNASGCDVITPDVNANVGTGMEFSLKKWIDDSIADTYTAVVYGDVDGDGIYDGTDAYKVSLIANGLLTKEQVGDAVWNAADCNHDGVIDSNDVGLLEKAGLLLTTIDQSKPDEELQSDTAYIEYENLIDQFVEASDEITVPDETPEEPPEEEQPSVFEQILSKLYDFIKSIIMWISEIF